MTHDERGLITIMKSLNTPKNLKVLRRISLLSIIILMLATVFTVPLMAEKNSEEIIFSKKYVRKEGPVSTVEDEFSVDTPGDDFLLHIQSGTTAPVARSRVAKRCIAFGC